MRRIEKDKKNPPRASKTTPEEEDFEQTNPNPNRNPSPNPNPNPNPNPSPPRSLPPVKVNGMTSPYDSTRAPLGLWLFHGFGLWSACLSGLVPCKSLQELARACTTVPGRACRFAFAFGRCF